LGKIIGSLKFLAEVCARVKLSSRKASAQVKKFCQQKFDFGTSGTGEENL
jgi:hypothetical protein